jgi:hypothetical protein
MQKIIGGKLYDTETAEVIDSYHYSNPGDFRYVQELLLRSSKGAFFLHGEGGARTRYAEQVENNMWRGGEDIIPLDEAEARAWLEKHGCVASYLAVFGEPEEA